MKLFAAWIAQELSLTKAIGHLRRQAQTDDLTQCLTRGAFQDEAEAALSELAGGRPVSMIAFDLDHFKRINDTHGHGVGDAVLRKVSTICADLCRNSDRIGRIGGEEFVVLAAGADGGHALALANRLRAAMHAAPIVSGDARLRVTASFGVAPATPGDTFEAWLDRADQALYAAKRAGRNRCVLAPA